MTQFERIISKFESQIIQSIQNYELLDDIKFEVLNSMSNNKDQVVFYVNAYVEINNLSIKVYEFTHEHQPLLLKCTYDEPQGIIQFEITCNIEQMRLDIIGSKLKLSDQASHKVELINQNYRDEEYERLDKFVQEELDINNNLDFGRLYREYGEIKVKETVIE